MAAHTFTVGELVTVAEMNALLNVDGWVPMAQTLTYSSVDGPTGVVTTGGVDLTGVIPVGARIKFTQTTVKYFIVTAIDTTTITVYGGTDYTLVNAAITLPAFSIVKAPVGFNGSPLKWAQLLADTSHRTQATPTQSTWYNVGSLSLAIPIGCWHVTFEGMLGAADTSATTDVSATLSTANNTESDNQFTAYLYDLNGATGVGVQHSFHKRKPLLLAAKTTYYANVKTGLTTASAIGLYGANTPTIIRAECAYL